MSMVITEHLTCVFAWQFVVRPRKSSTEPKVQVNPPGMFQIIGIITCLILHLASARNDSLSKHYQFPNQNLVLADPSFNNKTLFYALHTPMSKQCTVIQEINPFTNYSVTKQCKFVMKVDAVQLVFGFGTEKAVLITQEATSKSLTLKTKTVHIADCKIVDAELAEVPLTWANRKMYRNHLDIVVSHQGFEVVIKGLSHFCTKPDAKIYCGVSFDAEGNKIEGPLIWPKMAYNEIDIMSPVMTDATGQGYFFVNRDESSLMAFQFNRKGGPKYVKLWYTPQQHTDLWREGYSVANEVDGMCYNVDSKIGCWQTDRQGELKMNMEFEFDSTFKANLKHCNTSQPPGKIQVTPAQVTETQETTSEETTTQSTTVEITTEQETVVTEATTQIAALETEVTETTIQETTATHIETTATVTQETTALDTKTEDATVNEIVTQENPDDTMEPITVKGLTVADVTMEDVTVQNATDTSQDATIITENTVQESTTLSKDATGSSTVKENATEELTTQESAAETETLQNSTSEDIATPNTVTTDDKTPDNTIEDNTVFENTTEYNNVQAITVKGLATEDVTTQESLAEENATESAITKTTLKGVSLLAFTVRGLTVPNGSTTPRILIRRALSETSDKHQIWNIFIHNLRNGGFIMFIVTCPNRVCSGIDDHFYLVKINAAGKRVGQLEINVRGKCHPENGEFFAKVFENDQGQYCAVRLCKSKLQQEARLETLVNCYCNSDFK